MNIVFHYLKQKVHVKHKIVRTLTEKSDLCFAKQAYCNTDQKMNDVRERKAINLSIILLCDDRKSILIALTRAFREYLSIHK